MEWLAATSMRHRNLAPQTKGSGSSFSARTPITSNKPTQAEISRTYARKNRRSGAPGLPGQRRKIGNPPDEFARQIDAEQHQNDKPSPIAGVPSGRLSDRPIRDGFNPAAATVLATGNQMANSSAMAIQSAQSAARYICRGLPKRSAENFCQNQTPNCGAYWRKLNSHHSTAAKRNRP